MNNQVLVDREWFDRAHMLLYIIAHEDGENGLEADCLGLRIPGILNSNAAPAPIPDADHVEDVRAMVVPEGLLRDAFPRIDITKPVPLDEKAHCCEYTIYVERERLHRLIDADGVLAAMLAASPAPGGE